MSVLKIKNGQNNWQSIPTINGRTPVKGTDYWTDEDKDEIVDYVIDSDEISDALDAKLDSPSTAGTDGQVLTSDGQGGQSWEDPTVAVEDVQVNGTSIVSNGVANIPAATTNTLGTVAVNNGYGIFIRVDGILTTVKPNSNTIKAGSSQYQPIVPSIQHESTFHGLAKAAGDTTQSASSNSVGTYTEEAKIAIQKMLGIYEAPWELIREDSVTNSTEADIEITVDGNGQPFELTDLYLEFWLTADTQVASAGSGGRIATYYSDTAYFSQYFGETSIAVGGNPKGSWLLIENAKGAIIRRNGGYVTMGTDRGAVYTPNRVDTNRSYLIFGDYIFNKIVIKAITGTGNYKLYGKRKWN